MYEQRPLRHECRLPNSLVAQPQEHSLTRGATVQELKRWFRDGRGLYVHVIRCKPETERVIYLRKAIRMKVRFSPYGNSGA